MSTVSVVIVPRERFSCAVESMRSVIAHCPSASEIVYVDAGSPADIAAQLAELADANGVRS